MLFHVLVYLFCTLSCTEPSESIHTPCLLLHCDVLQPEFKMDYIEIVLSLANLHTIPHNVQMELYFINVYK